MHWKASHSNSGKIGSMPRSTVLASLAFATALTAAACGDDDPLPSDPTPPASITETFSDTLTPNGGRTHTFVAERAGDVVATLSTLAPETETTVGLGIGTWNGVTCNVVIANDSAAVNASVIGSATGTGSLCVRLYDVGKLTTSVDYTVTVQHF